MRLCYCYVTNEDLSAEGGHSTAASSQSQSRLLIHLLIHLDKEGRACTCKRTNSVTLFTFFRVLKWKLCVYEDLLAKFFHSVWSWWASVHVMFTHSYVVSKCVRARRARWWSPSSPARRVWTLISSRVGRKTENGFSHFNFTHIFFEANESLKHSQTSGWHLHTQCHPVTVDEVLPACVCVCVLSGSMNTFRCCLGLQLISTCAEPVLLLCRAAGLSPLSVISLCPVFPCSCCAAHFIRLMVIQFLFNHARSTEKSA